MNLLRAYEGTRKCAEFREVIRKIPQTAAFASTNSQHSKATYLKDKTKTLHNDQQARERQTLRSI